MSNALLCVSFGTTVANGRADIEAVEAALQAAAPDHVFARAFTSSIVRHVLAQRGAPVDSVPQALEKLAAAGCRQVAVQPTHLLCGREYDKLKAELAPFAARFERLTLGQPLLYGTDDLRALAACVSAAYPTVEGEALLLMGHGTEHFAGVAYAALQTVFALAERPDIFVATVEGWPTLDDAKAQLQKAGYRKVRLVPLMLVAGDHACHDMAGDAPDSWQSILQRDGLQTCCVLQGLGRMPAVQALYARKLQALLGGTHAV